ncbi:MAG: hypothetical protein MZV63_55910 [Marinilabiliales bacterium]|nr:hypothetical protein [Marinilabiliales bacterium]
MNGYSLTVADEDEFAGIITIIFQVVGKTTALMRSLKEGDTDKRCRRTPGPAGRSGKDQERWVWSAAEPV